MKAKKPAKKMKTMKAVGVGAGVAAGLAAALAGAYLISGKTGQKKVKTWVVKAKRDAAREIKMLHRVGEKEYKAVVEKAMKHYGSLENVSMAEVMRVAADAKNEWKRIQSDAKKMAAMAAKKKPTKKSAKRPARRKVKKARK
jgi:hypothetical protein